MIFKNPAIRLSIALVLSTVNLLFLANLIGFVPDESELALEMRKGLSESLALQFSAAAEKTEFQTIQNTLRAVVERNEDIRSAAIRTSDGRLIALAGEHLAHWNASIDGKSTPTHVQVPVYRNGEEWARVEMRFAPLWTDSLMEGFTNSFAGLLIFVGLGSFLCYFFIIRRTLRELDPSAVIPERVQKAFDVLQEGVLILDEKEQIVMANKSFAGIFDKLPQAMIGLKGSELGWMECQTPKQTKDLPWIKVLQDGMDHMGSMLSLTSSIGSKVKLAVNAAVITDNAGKCRGSLVTFGDTTQLEEKNFELGNLVEKLQLSQEEIQAKSEELEFLANRDPMTHCLNRRSLDRNLNVWFTKARAAGKPLCCLMVDIDFFKSVNDRYGHATGDQVIKAVADVLRACTREKDLVGRYGGEEFCVALPELKLELAAQIAERIRQEIEKEPCGGVKITVSVGVSSLDQNASKPDQLVNQADKALYAAKKGGRNRVVTWGKEEAFDSVHSAGGQAKERQQSAVADDSGEAMTNHAQLQYRAQELEGLLEKQSLEFEHHKMYDPMTGLPTRSLFDDRISHEIAKSKRYNSESLVVVLSMTIDTIKRVYQTLGADNARQLIEACADRLNDHLRQDLDTVAVVNDKKESSSACLFNQNEFGILLTDIKQVDNVTWAIKRLQDAISKPFQVKGQEIYASAYIGVSIFPHDGQTSEELYSSAVRACSYAEKMNESRYMFASQDINAMAVRQLQVESCLRGAIDKEELQLHFQPLIEAVNGRVGGFEVLLRWQSAQLGAVQPGEFIPVAERSGLIDRIGDWVLYNACKQLKAWRDAGLEVCSLAVNVSGVQLRQQNLAKRVQEVLAEFNLESHLLELELTESAIVNSYDKSFTVLKQINELGIRISIDDFGTGYSSLSYLKNIPLSCFKIDRSFVADIGKDKNSETLIASIVTMAHNLGVEVVAEGIEDQQQAEHLIALGCERLQGYYFSRPVPQGEVPMILSQNPKRLTGS